LLLLAAAAAKRGDDEAAIVPRREEEEGRAVLAEKAIASFARERSKMVSAAVDFMVVLYFCVDELGDIML